MRKVELILPWPPSNNTYYRHVGSKVLLSEAGRKYRKAVADIVLVSFARLRSESDLKVAIRFIQPDRRRRDVDNLLKGLFDSMQHAGVYKDDSQIKSLHCEMEDPIDFYKGGAALVTVEEM
jgi:crossover junction endodeoxyribonuclease RusA